MFSSILTPSFFFLLFVPFEWIEKWVEKIDYWWRVRQAARALSKPQAHPFHDFPSFMLPRNDVMKNLEKRFNDRDFRTVLVYGTSGSGKTTAIQWFLRERACVMNWTIHPVDCPNVRQQLNKKWEELFSQWRKEKLFDRYFDHHVCAHMRDHFNTQPVIVISVNLDATPDAMIPVACFCKKVAAERHSARAIIDVSSSNRMVVDPKWDLWGLRVKGVSVGNVSEIEMGLVLKHCLPQNWPVSRKDTITYAIIQKFDCNLLTVKHLCMGFHDGMSSDEAIAHIEFLYGRYYKRIEHQLEELDRHIFKEISTMRDEMRPCIPNLLQQNPPGLDQEGMVQLRRMLTFWGLIEFLSKIGAPHIFTIDPFTEQISLNGKLVERVFVDYYSRPVEE